MAYLFNLAWITLLALNTWAATEPTLTVKSSGATRTFTRSELLKRASAKNITLRNDPAYPGLETKYRAIPAADLFEGMDTGADATILFRCLDGFSAPIEKDRLLNLSPSKSVAYIAIEQEGEKWPRIKPQDPRTPAPFYLIWLNPELSNIGPEEWPFMLSGFEVKPGIRDTYPAILPDPKLPADHAINRGFKSFLKNCFACHTLNGQGTSEMGPDLNQPLSPTEYMNPTFLKILIRDPQALRRWPQAKMSPFPESILSEAELQDLIQYLSHMAKRRN